MIATDRRIDEQADHSRVDTGVGEGLRPGHRCSIGKRHIGRPPAPLTDAGEALEHARDEPDTLIGLKQLLIDLLGGDNYRGIDDGHR